MVFRLGVNNWGLSKKISEELGHQIRIESEVGKGTTVRIQFAQVNLVLE
ncbi:histidine kinase [Streptococcus pneumoniae]|nr:histidine kinase [Streptococcus pneumoniae]